MANDAHAGAHDKVRRWVLFSIRRRCRVEAKKWYASKVIWFNVLMVLVLVAGAFGFTDFEVSPQVEQWATLIILVVNLILRFVTKQPVKV